MIKNGFLKKVAGSMVICTMEGLRGWPDIRCWRSETLHNGQDKMLLIC